VEPDLVRRIDKLNRDLEGQVDRRLARAVKEVFKKALSEMSALSTAGLRVRLADPSGPESSSCA